MPIFKLFSSKPGPSNSPRITAGDIRNPIDFRHTLHIGPTTNIRPNELRELFQDKNSVTTAHSILSSPPSHPGLNLQASEETLPERAVRDRILEKRPVLPYLNDLQDKVKEIGNGSRPPPLPPRMQSLAPDSTVRSFASENFPPPPLRLAVHRPLPSAPLDALSSMPIATQAGEARGVGRVRERAAAVNRGDRSVMTVIEDAPFI